MKVLAFVVVATMFEAVGDDVFQLVNYLFFRNIPSSGVLVGGAFIIAGSAIVYLWK
jgi:hypothetical protein